MAKMVAPPTSGAVKRIILLLDSNDVGGNVLEFIIDIGEVGDRVVNSTVVAIPPVRLDESGRVPGTKQLNLAVMKHRIALAVMFSVVMCKLTNLH